MSTSVSIYSEIGKLKRVLLHRPGSEIENLIPSYLDRLLFDDIPYLKVAKEEHENFAKVLRQHGSEVLYVEELIAEAIGDDCTRSWLISQFIEESGLRREDIKSETAQYLSTLSNADLVRKMISGVREKDLGFVENKGEFPFVTYPMPNLYFTRDPVAVVGGSLVLSKMKVPARQRESIFAKFIFRYNDAFENLKLPYIYEHGSQSIEGGDILVLSKEIIAIGESQRTTKAAVMSLAKKLFKAEKTFKKILLISIPVARAFMHLDTVMTMVDLNKFTVHPGIEGELKVSVITRCENCEDLCIKEEKASLAKILSTHLEIDIKLIRCGGEDKVVASREQWNDGANTLALEPGKVVTYERNYVTNELLDKNNIEVITIPSAELSRGRGGPRCMSMPLLRDEIP